MAMMVKAKLVKQRSNGANMLFLSKKEIQSLLAKIEKAPIAVSSYNLLPIKHSHKETKQNVSEIFASYLSNKLPGTRRDANARGVLSLLIDPEEVKAARTVIPECSDPHLFDVLKLLKIESKTFWVLEKRGFFCAFQQYNQATCSTRTYVEQKSLSAFMKKYVSIGVLAKELGTKASGLSTHLDSVDIYPCFREPNINRIYERKNVDFIYPN